MSFLSLFRNRVDLLFFGIQEFRKWGPGQFLMWQNDFHKAMQCAAQSTWTTGSWITQGIQSKLVVTPDSAYAWLR